MKQFRSALSSLFMLGALVACSAGHDAGRSIPPGAGALNPGQVALPANLRNFVPPPPPLGAPRRPSGGRRVRGAPANLPPFFSREQDIGGGFYSLTFANGTPFGDYTFLTDANGNPNYIWHEDLAYEYFQDAADSSSGIYFYDFASTHWFYTNPTSFPALYDFWYASWLSYEPLNPPQGAHFYGYNPPTAASGPYRVFYNFKFGGDMQIPGLSVYQPNSSNTIIVPADDQCGSPVPSADIMFPLHRDTNSTKPDDPPNSSACIRNQLLPQDNGHNYWLGIGVPYTFTFETIVTLNNNYTYNGANAAEIPGLVWQTHGENGGPCDHLVIQNTRFLNINGWPYANVPPGGQAVWNFSTCDAADFSPPSYNDPNPPMPTSNADDQWEIDIVPRTMPSSGPPTGYIQVHRNGTIVFDTNASVCPAGQTQCWWDFGPYMFHWASTMPSDYDTRGINVEFKNLTLYKNAVP